MSDYTKIDVVVCALNEEKTVAGVIRPLKSIPVIGKVILVDDGSTDNTSEEARNAGADVLRIEPNAGKANAMRKGLELVTTPLVLFWDADLIGTNEDHVMRMLDPHLLHDLDMTVGVIQTFGQKAAPDWSGERLVKTDKMREFFEAHPHISRFSVERELTEWAMSHNWGKEYPPLPALKHVQKEEKRGPVKGFIDRMKMYSEILLRK